MTHVYHDALPGYHPDQILHDGCPECEYRGKSVKLALACMDSDTFAHAWIRAGEMNELDNISVAEYDILATMHMVRVAVDRGVIDA